MKKIIPVILAAGKGSRIGQPKWQLVYQGETFLSRIIDTLLRLQFNEIVCVVRTDSVPQENRVKMIFNEHPEEGMLSSIYCGVQANLNVDGFIIWPVDHPFVTENAITALIAVFNQNSDSVVCPCYQNQSGHPIIIPSKIAEKIPKHDIMGGLRQWLMNEGVAIHRVLVRDAGMIKNINTQEDLSEQGYF